ncbi:hypothetical protein SASPL_131422 [Salvia splendens]|uniref:Rab-GAP TBC domain-containing protein n=1 Tax=Salvia splendens TaxID=180675 RepID=A0A8X8X7F4_SALSN|nr:hypothetical protein SASPL_131422 [Salvia splendens]
MRNSSNNRAEDRNKEVSSSSPATDSRFHQTLRNVQGLLKGRSFPGKILITQRSDPLDPSTLHSPNIDRRSPESDRDQSEQQDRSTEKDELQNRSSTNASSSVNNTKPSSTSSQSTSKEIPKSNVGARATDSARLMKFTKELSGSSVILEYLEGSIDTWSMADLSREKILNVEADSYWCLSKLLDGMQDHYTFAQPGIQRLVFKLKELVRRIDEPVLKHIEEQGLEFLQFAFRWFNCLLIREIPFSLVSRLWDTYLAEGDALADFLVYISASFLLTWSEKIRKLDFQEMVMFLQHLPTHNWTVVELEMVLSQAYMWHTMFNNSPSHLAG